MIVIESALYLYDRLLDERSIQRPDGDIYRVKPGFWCPAEQAGSSRPDWLRFDGTMMIGVFERTKVDSAHYSTSELGWGKYRPHLIRLAMPFVLRARVRGWLRRPPAVRRAPERSGPSPPVATQQADQSRQSTGGGGSSGSPARRGGYPGFFRSVGAVTAVWPVH